MIFDILKHNRVYFEYKLTTKVIHLVGLGTITNRLSLSFNATEVKKWPIDELNFHHEFTSLSGHLIYWRFIVSLWTKTQLKKTTVFVFMANFCLIQLQWKLFCKLKSKKQTWGINCLSERLCIPHQLTKYSCAHLINERKTHISSIFNPLDTLNTKRDYGIELPAHYTYTLQDQSIL